MPRIKRWFPMSQDINRDPEMWEFRALVGQRADSIWEEILSIADRNEGELPGRWDSYPTLLAHACHSTPTRLRLASDWLTTPRGRRLLPWVAVDSEGTARVVNHVKYHRSEERKPIPTRESIRSLPSEPSEPNLPKEPLTPLVIPDWIPSEPWEAYLRHRKHKRAKVTPEAAEGLIEKLSEFKKQGEDVTAILKQSVINGWTGLFPVGHAGNGRGSPPLPTSQVPAYVPFADEPRPTKEQQAKVKALLQDLGEKID